MIRTGFTIGAVYALVVGHIEFAVVWALLAIAWQPSSSNMLRSWLGWDDAIARARAQREATLFEGTRDD